VLSATCWGQNGLQDAGGNTSILQGARAGKSISLDVNDSRVSFTWNTSRLGAFGADVVCTELDAKVEAILGDRCRTLAPGDTIDACMERVRRTDRAFKDAEDERAACQARARGPLYGGSNNFTIAFAAQEGKRTLFDDDEFTPGAELHDKLGFTWEVGEGFVGLFGSADLEVVGRKTAQTSPNPDNPNIPLVDSNDDVGTTLDLGMGANWMPVAEAGVFGISAQWERNWNVPVAQQTSQVCGIQTVGTSDDTPTTISKCSQRFVGPVKGGNGGVFRFDWVSPRWNPSTGKLDSIEQVPTHLSDEDFELFKTGVAGALIFGSQIRIRDDVKPEYNIAVGPALFKAYQPLAIIGAVLFEFDDLSNSSGQAPDFSDKFAVRLYIGAPF
jgi:hypothetical protein